MTQRGFPVLFEGEVEVIVNPGEHHFLLVLDGCRPRILLFPGDSPGLEEAIGPVGE